MPNGESSFLLSETNAFTGTWTMHLNARRVCMEYSGVSQEQPWKLQVKREAIEEFASVLDYLRVWEWRANYEPRDCDAKVYDGGSWKFVADMRGRQCLASGVNAYPAFGDPKETSLNAERYGVLVATVFHLFGIEPVRNSLSRNS